MANVTIVMDDDGNIVSMKKEDGEDIKGQENPPVDHKLVRPQFSTCFKGNCCYHGGQWYCW